MPENATSLQLPEHIAIILDGNGRWARKKKKTISYGHRKGVERAEKILEYASRLGIKIITLYAFSSENWQRPEAEKKVLFQLLETFFKKKIKKIIQKDCRVKIIGNTAPFSPRIKKLLKDTEKKTKNNKNSLIQIALSYGGRDEIIRAAKKCYRDLKNNKIKTSRLNEDTFKRYLDTGTCSDPDLLIRTGGEQRISNFLLYQIAYTEFFFSKVLWPDFTEKELDKAIKSYNNRERRFGARL
ncbi:MAG TPA: isoprenyl transferase [Spirochaetota bacterium]|nr:isoprenyl transferase [Spirochaetota bacterium]